MKHDIAEALRRDVSNILHAVQRKLDGRSFADLVDHPVVRVERGEIVLGGRGHDGCNYELALKSDVMSRRVGSETITDAGRLALAELMR